MAQELTPTSYIGHHLTNRVVTLGDSPFWTLHVDTLITSAVLGVARALRVACAIGVGALTLATGSAGAANSPAAWSRAASR